MFLTFVLVFLGVFIAINVIHVAARNVVAHQFFQKYARNIPVLEKPELFAGHIRMGLDRKNWLHISNLHKRFGKSFGYYYTDQPWVSTIDIDLLKKILIDEGNLHINRRNLLFPLVEFNESIMQTRDDVWRNSRKALAPSLTSHQLNSDDVSGAMNKTIEKSMKRLDRMRRDAADKTGKGNFVLLVDDHVARIAMAVLLSIAYNKDDKIDFDAEKDHWLEALHAGLTDTKNPLVVLGVIFPMFRPIREMAIKFSKLGRMQLELRKYVHQVLRDIRSSSKKASYKTGNEVNHRKRMVESAIDAYLKKKITYRDVVSNMFGMFLAGYVTTADTMTCFLWLMAFHPEVQDKLRNSLQQEGSGCEYLQWCLLECVRLYPAVPLGVGKELSHDIEHNGMFIPKTCVVSPAIKTIHTCEDIWPEATKFKPERWANRAEFHPAAFMGFGLGPRNCPGRMLAQQEIRLTMSEILTTYRVEKCSQTVETLNISSPIMFHTMMDDPIYLQFVPL